MNQQSQNILKQIATTNNETKELLETLESYILSTSELINERLEEVHRQMGDLHSEIRANIELVKEKKRMNASDTSQFMKVLGEDVRQFIACMREEIEQIVLQIKDRDSKCSFDMQRIESKISQNENQKNQLTTSQPIGSSDSKELSKIEAFREHTLALTRHLENTSAYLQREVSSVDSKIDESR